MVAFSPAISAKLPPATNESELMKAGSCSIPPPISAKEPVMLAQAGKRNEADYGWVIGEQKSSMIRNKDGQPVTDKLTVDRDSSKRSSVDDGYRSGPVRSRQIRDPKGNPVEEPLRVDADRPSVARRPNALRY